MIGVLKSLRFLDETGRPTQRYFEFLDQTQSGRVLADAIKDAYRDLFAINVNAQAMSRAEFINKSKTLSQGSIGDSVLDKMAMTFTTLVGLADFEATGPRPAPPPATSEPPVDAIKPPLGATGEPTGRGSHINPSLVYNIQIHLPESRDPAVYDVLFKSLKEHLL